jgi:glycerophosphoryl diester phosphodiesterase
MTTYLLEGVMQQRIIAHRGHKTEAPEQTMAAYRMAVELGAEMIEADVQLSRDGVAVMMHDWTLERTTSGRGPVSGLDWAEIATLDAGSWFDPRFASERVPRLEELFALAEETGTALCLEAKGETLAENLAVSLRIGEEIARRGRLEVDVLASFDHEALREAAVRVPGLRVAPDRLPEHGVSTAEALLRQARAIGAPIIQHHFADLRPEVAAEVQAAGVEIWAWPPTSPEEVAVAIASGAIGIMGDDVRNIVVALRR